MLQVKFKEWPVLFLVIGKVCRTFATYSDGNHRVPNVNANSDGDFKFNLGNFENDWNAENVLLCFCDSYYFSHYHLAGVFSCRFFFQPPSIRPTSSNRRINDAYILWSITFCSHAICRKNFNKSVLPIACETSDSFSNLSYANIALNIISKTPTNVSSIFVPIV
jgi:hypothetical protein